MLLAILDKVTGKVTDKDDPEMSKLQGQASFLSYFGNGRWKIS